MKSNLPIVISHDSIVFGRGYDHAYDTLLEVLEEQEIDFEIPFTKREKYI